MRLNDFNSRNGITAWNSKIISPLISLRVEIYGKDFCEKIRTNIYNTHTFARTEINNSLVGFGNEVF